MGRERNWDEGEEREGGRERKEMRLGEGGKKKVGSKVFALIKYVRGIKYLFVVF